LWGRLCLVVNWSFNVKHSHKTLGHKTIPIHANFTNQEILMRFCKIRLIKTFENML
jgi:hypothetical protein